MTADLEGSDEQVAFGGKHGYGLLSRKTGRYEYIKKFWNDKEVSQGKEKRMRANDGAVDSKGRFWVGTMNDPLVVDEPGPEGSFRPISKQRQQLTSVPGTLFRLDPDGKLHRVLEGVTIPNGMSWTKDEKTMYITDSPTKTISAFDYDKETGSISNRRPFFKVEEEDGVPDGHAVDLEGFLWVCCFGLGKVRRVSPEGKVVAEIELPTRCCSCPVIAGEDLFVTSAEEEAPKKFPDSVKYAGSLFKCHIGVTGKKPLRFRWNGSSA